MLWQNVEYGCAGTIIGEEMHRSLIAKTASVYISLVYAITFSLVITEFLARALGKGRPRPRQIGSASEVLMENSQIIIIFYILKFVAAVFDRHADVIRINMRYVACLLL